MGRMGKGKAKGAHRGGRVGGDGVGEEGRFDEESLMRRELGGGVAGANVQGYDWRFEIAMCVRSCVLRFE